MMIHTSLFTLVLMILSAILTVMHADNVEDPCPSKLNHTANMCTDDDVIEDSTDGSHLIDSVLLRIAKHQNNCICHVTLQKNVPNYTIYMSKYEGQSNAAPKQQNCGLAIDVGYLDELNTTRSLNPIDCTFGTSKRSFALFDNELKFTSRIIDGDFTMGYCMQIYRDQKIFSCKMNDPQMKTVGKDGDWFLAIRNQSFDHCKGYCLQTQECVAVHYESDACFVYNQTSTTDKKDNAVYVKKQCVDTQKLKIRCYLPESEVQTSKGTTLEESSSTKMKTVTTPTDDYVTNSYTLSTLKEKKEIKEDKNYDMYVYLGAAAGGVLMILLIVCIIVCIRKQSHTTSLKESKNVSNKEFCNDSRDSDNDYGGLKDNILYVSSEPNEILEDGNYNTVDMEQTRKVEQNNTFDGNYSTVDGMFSNSSLSKSKPVIKPKPNASLKRGSDEETIHLSTMDNSNNEYAVVDKGRNSDDVKHINPEQRNDTEYAVVNKVKRSSNNN